MPTPDKLPGIIQSDINGQDILIVNDGGQTKKITLAMLSQYLGTAGVEGSHILNIVFTSSTGGDEPGIAGATDTYTITFREEDESTGTETFEVHNGSNGVNGQNGLPIDNITDNDPVIGSDTIIKFFIGGNQVGEDITVKHGVDGIAATVTVGDTVTLAPGEDAEVENIGSNTNADLIFSIPRGEKGEASTEAGPQGAYYVKAFTRNATRPARPTELTWTPEGGVAGPDSNTWEAEIPEGTEQTWEVQSFFNPDTDTEITSWSSVFQAGAEGQKGDNGENLEVAGYDLVGGANPGTTVRLQTAETDAAAGQFFVEKGDTGEKGNPGNQGDPGAPVDNVVVDHSAGPGGTTQIHFEVEGAQIGSQINIPPGERGSTGIQGEQGETLKVAGSSQDGAGNTTVVLETRVSEEEVGSFLVQRGLKGETGLTGPGYNDITNNGTTPAGTAITFVGVNGATNENLTIPRGAQGNQGVYQVQVFQVHGDSAPAKPVGGEWDSSSRTWTTLPSGWVAEPALDTTGTHVWESFAIFDPANPTDAFLWSEPFIAGAQGPSGAIGIHGTSVDAEFDGTNLTVTETTYDANGAILPADVVVNNVRIVGSDGAPGTSIHSGSGVPLDSLGENGDVYINVAPGSGDVYNKVSGSWGSPVGSIEGDKGDSGQTVLIWFASDANGTGRQNTPADGLDYITFQSFEAGSTPPASPTSGYIKFVGEGSNVTTTTTIDNEDDTVVPTEGAVFRYVGTIGTLDSLSASDIPNLDTSKITSGTFEDARIPNINASKTNAGEFDTARIPSLDASKITSGEFNGNRIPDLNASKINAGTFDAARIPNGFETSGAIGQIAVKESTTNYDTKWVGFTSGYNSSHQQVGFQSNGTSAILASVDLSGYTPLTPSGGGPTTSNMFSSVSTSAPTVFDTSSMTDNGAASHQKSIALPYNDQSGTVEQWALIAIPNDLIGSGTVRFSTGSFDLETTELTNGTSGFTGYYFQFFEAFTVTINID